MSDVLDAAAGKAVPRETRDKLFHFEQLLRSENLVQNLVSAATLEDFTNRHLVDSAQIVRLAPDPNASWVDIGSGGGLPGIVIALLTDGPVTLVEPRRLRADFLTRVVDALDLSGRVSVVKGKAEGVAGDYDIITGRAVANLSRFLGISRHLAHEGTMWLLPKGRSADQEVEEARRSWHCAVTNVPSMTDPEAAILVLQSVKAR